jgi:hypothetical protein
MIWFSMFDIRVSRIRITSKLNPNIEQRIPNIKQQTSNKENEKDHINQYRRHRISY